MKSSALKNAPRLLVATAIIVVSTAVWAGGKGLAIATEASVPVKAETHVVVDKQPELDLDLKIFLHRNGFVLTNGREPGRG